MVQEIIISEDAMLNLKSIQAFISHDSKYQAEKFVWILFDEAQKIGKFPESGTIVRELAFRLSGNGFITNTASYTNSQITASKS